MNTLEFIKNFRRLCHSQSCGGCPCYNKNVENCSLLSIGLTDEETIKYIKVVEEWTEEHPIEIDWYKVPKDTPVYVSQNKTDEKKCRYFDKYCPNSNEPFQCYSGGQTSWSSDGLMSWWGHCELAREEDVEKYAKEEI